MLMMPICKYRLMFFCVIIISLVIAALFILLGFKYHMYLLIIFGPLLSVMPAIFVRLKINFVAKKARIHFFEEYIEITSQDILINRFIYSEIKYFSVSKIAVDYASRINLVLRNGTKRKYIFFKQAENAENVLNNILFYFSTYNIGKIQEEKIQVLPSFFLTIHGRIILAVIGLLILSVLIMQIIYKPKTIPYSFLVVLGAYIQIKGIQRNGREILRNFRDEN